MNKRHLTDTTALPLVLQIYGNSYTLETEVVEALRIMDEYQFSLVAGLAFLGLSPGAIETGREFRDFVFSSVLELNDLEILARLRFITKIRHQLDAWFPGRLQEQLQWMKCWLTPFSDSGLSEIYKQPYYRDLHKAIMCSGG